MELLTALDTFLKEHMGLALLLSTVLILLKDTAVDFLSRQSAALASDGNPKNDWVSRLFASVAVVLSKIRLPFGSKKE